jgi:hypothetical protein
VKSLDIGYKFLTHVNHEPFCVLSSATHWLELAQNATEAIEHLKTSRVKTLKPFEVHLKDFRVTVKAKGKKGGKGGTDGTGKESSSGRVKGKGVKRARETGDEDNEEDEGDDGKGRICESGWVAWVQNRTACDKHQDDNCYVDATRTHWKLSKQDLSYWGLMIICIILSALFLLANTLFVSSHAVLWQKTLSNPLTVCSSRSHSRRQRHAIVFCSLVGPKVWPLPSHPSIHIPLIPLLCTAAPAPSLWVLCLPSNP